MFQPISKNSSCESLKHLICLIVEQHNTQKLIQNNFLLLHWLCLKPYTAFQKAPLFVLELVVNSLNFCWSRVGLK